jgi:hypothetical protein
MSNVEYVHQRTLSYIIHVFVLNTCWQLESQKSLEKALKRFRCFFNGVLF